MSFAVPDPIADGRLRPEGAGFYPASPCLVGEANIFCGWFERFEVRYLDLPLSSGFFLPTGLLLVFGDTPGDTPAPILESFLG